MALKSEIEKARKTIATDGYDMSVGEIVNLYQDKEIIINPAFQRLFRWDLYNYCENLRVRSNVSQVKMRLSIGKVHEAITSINV